MLASGASAYAYMLQTVVNDTTRARMSGGSRRSLRWVHELAGCDDNIARDRTSRHEHNQHHHHTHTHTHTTTTASTTTTAHIHHHHHTHPPQQRGHDSWQPETRHRRRRSREAMVSVAPRKHMVARCLLTHTQLPSLHARDRSTATCVESHVADVGEWLVLALTPLAWGHSRR
jgi:hypothetical protein